jgi:glycosyltransferase involved in cell wall biosynthesis
MKLLFVSVVMPYPLDAGGSIGLFKTLEELSKRHEITLICPLENPKVLADFQKKLNRVDIRIYSKTTAMSSKAKLKKLIGGFIRPKAPQPKAQLQLYTTNLVPYYHENLLEVLENTLSEKNFDAVEVDFVEMLPIIHFLPKTLPKVFVHHEIRHRRLTLELNAIDAKNKEEEYWKIQNIKALEIGLLNLYDKVVCLTVLDKERLVEDGLSPEKIRVSPLPVSFENIEINQPFTFKNKLVYLGPDAHYPNFDAVKWFLENCWNSILEANPTLHFEVVGKWSKENVKLFSAYKNVNFRGFMKQLKTVLDGAIMIMPLRIGGGMRMKILEAASWHTPMISTRIGAEGLPMIHAQNTYLADTAEDFIRFSIDLCQNSSMQHQFIEASKELFSLDFSMETCGKIREQVFTEMLS